MKMPSKKYDQLICEAERNRIFIKSLFFALTVIIISIWVFLSRNYHDNEYLNVMQKISIVPIIIFYCVLATYHQNCLNNIKYYRIMKITEDNYDSLIKNHILLFYSACNHDRLYIQTLFMSFGGPPPMGSGYSPSPPERPKIYLYNMMKSMKLSGEEIIFIDIEDARSRLSSKDYDIWRKCVEKISDTAKMLIVTPTIGKINDVEWIMNDIISKSNNYLRTLFVILPDKRTHKSQEIHKEALYKFFDERCIPRPSYITIKGFVCFMPTPNGECIVRKFNFKNSDKLAKVLNEFLDHIRCSQVLN